MRRRRFLQIAGVAAGLPCQAWAEPRPLRWRGTALGAEATIVLHHPDQSVAMELVARSLAEVERLEKIFSLYQSASAIHRLNRDGRLEHPPMELVELLATSTAINRATDGAFDPTVQPLWDLYASHFSRPGADPQGPSREALASALEGVGSTALEIESGLIRFPKPRMAITLNGIAQGYITDKIVDLLRAAGINRTLVDMGEVRVMDGPQDGAAWRVGLEDPVFPGSISREIELVDRAVATSGGYGCQFDPEGRFNHIFNPVTGGCSEDFLSVSVIAETATLADGLSTAFSVMTLAKIRPAVARFGIRAFFTMRDGSCVELAA